MTKEVKEDAVPANHASSGAIAGLGTPGANGEPGVARSRVLRRFREFTRRKRNS